jgi:hypothetical protein
MSMATSKVPNPREQAALFFGTLDKFPQFVLELVDCRFCNLQFTHVSQPSIGRDINTPPNSNVYPLQRRQQRRSRLT